ncbi:MAG: hypothetical protein IJ304_03055, partial [Clostridia bacterium]|nr:hypothetical protein [Clostridia bacterium]
MFKKTLGLILCVAMLISVVSPAYAAKDTTWKQEALRQLGIYQENLVTYDGFTKSIAGFFYDNPDEISAEEFAKSVGMLEANEEYKGQSALTVGNALKLAVIALGYKPVLGENGNYIQKASQVGIADGISANSSTKLKADVATDILYAMLDAEPLVKTYGGKQGVAYEVAYGESLLSINRDISKVRGLLTGTETTSIYGKDGIAKDGCIIIDKVTYYAGEVSYDRFLGKNVIAYVQETDELENTVLCVSETSTGNKTVIIDCEDITDIGDSISTITYQETKTKTKTLKIIASPRVLYNGMFLEDYVEADFKSVMLEIIDYDGDKVYDVI